MNKVWLVTGSASGLGRNIAEAVLESGDRLVATARDTSDSMGGMRTNWGARANQDTPELLPDYEPSVGAVAKALKSYWGKEISDPTKVAQVVLRLASSDRLPAHLLIGSDAVLFAAEDFRIAVIPASRAAGGDGKAQESIVRHRFPPCTALRSVPKHRALSCDRPSHSRAIRTQGPLRRPLA